ncbi:uncharacterized protein LOC134270887 [Saccostrea cucullata]|uniref:uncharacterized protein LOC134270887 n=1 Tax=Saccostrea cuccullata TaxID=36930 RepID=UPI002ED3141C
MCLLLYVLQMPKRKSLTGRDKHMKAKLRKREERQKASQSLSDVSLDKNSDATPSHCVEDETASPKTLLGQGFIGLPPLEEKPLARVQASPRVKMHSNAPRLPSPRGSRLFVRNNNKDKAPSPDSPPWVCTPPRVPGHDDGFKPSPAGQAQLDTSRAEETSRTQEHIEHGNQTRENLKHENQRKQNENQCIKKKYLNCEHMFESHVNQKCQHIDHDRNDEEEENISYENEQISSSFSVVQGSFHQGEMIFGENAGTQCVANCLSGIAYHNIKNAKYWQRADINKVLATGDELYTYLQRSSTIKSRYLLVSELPQYFECFGRMFEFEANESIASVINLSNAEVCYDDFSAYSLRDALQLSLGDTNGCIVCFGGNAFLVGKTDNGFFTFDPHSRSSQGLLSVTGKSTRLLYQTFQEIYEHIWSLALSMGYSAVVDCEITGVHCSLKQIIVNKCDSTTKEALSPSDKCEVDLPVLDVEKKLPQCGGKDGSNADELCYLYTENENIGNELPPLSAAVDMEIKKNICHKLVVSQQEKTPFSDSPSLSSFSTPLSYAKKREVKKNKYREYLEKKKWKYKKCSEERKKALGRNRMRYKDNPIFRKTVIHHAKQNYEKYRDSLQFKENVKTRSKKINKKMYSYNPKYQLKKKFESIQRYKTCASHQQKVKEASKQKYKMNPGHKETVKKASVHKYKTNPEHRETVKEASIHKYKTNPEHRETVKEASIHKYKTNPEHKQHVMERSTEKYKINVMHRENVKATSAKRYKNLQFKGAFLKNWKISAEAAVNRMKVPPVPMELKTLNSLEKQLISIHIPFMKVMNLPQGRQKNVHGPVVCVPSDLNKASSLPRTADATMLLRVKLKRKLSFKGYQEYQFVNPHHVIKALNFLMENNIWYKDIQLNMNWEVSAEDDCLIEADKSQPMSETEDTDDQDPPAASIALDTCLQPIDVVQEVLDHYFDDVFNLAPGEGKNPVRMLQDEGNEAKTFPYLFPTGENSWNENRDIKITLSRYFHNRLMNADNRYAKDSNYVFFCQYMSELNQVIEKTQISVRKSSAKTTSGQKITSEILQDVYKLAKLLRNDDALRFMQPIRGTPSYWQAAQKDLFAMLRQIGIPTWFCSFSAAEFRWNTTIDAILRQQCDDRHAEDLDWTEKSEVLRSNPVTVARMFEHRFHVFLHDVIMSPSEPIGKVIDYFQRVEFQQRGSPHMHCLFWIEGAPKLDEDGEDAVCEFIDRYVTCEIPSESEDAELRKIVQDVQQHSKKHSQSCRKKGTDCRFNFPRPPSKKTFLAKPRNFEEDTENESNGNLVLKRNDAKAILQKVWENIQDPTQNLSSTEIFYKLGISQELFEDAYSIITSKQTIVLQREPSEAWTNQYNPCLLKSWDANLDIQYVLDPFSCIVYIISYISKSEREMGMLLKQTKNEAEEGNLSARQTMKKIGSAYLHHREVSAQEAVYRVCNLKMKECSRKVTFIPVGENPTRLSKPLHQMNKSKEMAGDDDDDEDDIWMTNIVERYENRPKLQEFADMCLATICADYRVLAKSQVPSNLREGIFELQNGKGYIQKRTRTKPAIIRFPRFNKEKMPEKFYQSILQLFLPYWKEDQLKPPKYELFQTFYESGCVRLKSDKKVKMVREIVDMNKQIYCKNEDVLDQAQETYEIIGEPEDAWALLCPQTEESRENCMKRKSQELQNQGEAEDIPDLQDIDHNADLLYQIQNAAHSRQKMLPLLRNLNATQRGAGTGKSHLINTVLYEASRLFSRTLTNPESISVLLTALTGTAAFNIGGTTLHHAFALTKYLPIPYEPLQEQRLSSIRVKLEDLQILIIDEISMVYKRLLYYVHERLVQIKKCKLPFGGVSVIAVGDFYQLPPVKQKKTERLYNDCSTYPVDYWKELFKVVELHEIMRQREDATFAEALNSLRVRTSKENLEPNVAEMLLESVSEGSEDALHVYATNEEVNKYNLSMLTTKCLELVEINAKDYQKDQTSGKLNLRENPIAKKKAEGLPMSIILAHNARVMLTRNIDVDDGLVNGVMGFISEIQYANRAQKEVSSIGVIFDNKDVGKKIGRKINSDSVMVLIERVDEEINEKHVKSVVRHQFPLQLSWACTAHKVQGMTTNEIVVNLDKVFSPGQAYVALSRVTSKQGLHIETSQGDIQNLLRRKIYADPDVKNAVCKMQKLEITTNLAESDCKRIVLHNIQGLPANFKEMKSDTRFQKANVICLTETWLQEQSSVQFSLQGFRFMHTLRKNSYDKSKELYSKIQNSNGGGVGTYIHDGEEARQIDISVPNIEVVAFVFQENISVFTVYRPSSLIKDFFISSLEQLTNFIKRECENCIILGDFNENAVDDTGTIQKFLNDHGFKQLVTFPTTEGRTIIDHVYVYGLQEYHIDVSLLPTYYSYHEAIIVKLFKK